MKILKAFFLVGILLLISLTSLAYADPQASATASLNFTLTFKDASGAVIDTSYLNTDWGLGIWYSKSVFQGSPVNVSLIDTYANDVLINGLNQSRTASQGTALGQSGVTGSYSASTDSSTIGMSNQAEVGGGLLNARSESISSASSIYNLTFSDRQTPIYLYINYDYSIAFQTTVLDPSRPWEWSAGGSVAMSLAGGGRNNAGLWEYVYPYADPSPIFDSSKFELFRIFFSEWVAGNPSGSISGSNSLSPISLNREGFNTGIGWNLTADVYATASAPGVEGPSTAIPEPATMLLLGSGLIGLAGYGRKKFFKK